MSFDQELLSLPHGPEFRFIDDIESIDYGKTAKAIYVIKGDEEFLKGHFPTDPIFPGVLMIEAIAQLGGIIAQTDPAEPILPGLRLTAVKNAKILGTSTPGSTITITASVEGRMGTLIQVKGSVAEGETIICQAMVTLSGA